MGAMVWLWNSRKKWEKHIRRYVSTLILVWLAIIFYRTNPYYARYLLPRTQEILWWCAIIYTVVGLPYYWFKGDEPSKGRRAVRTLKRLFFELREYVATFVHEPFKKLPKISHEEKTALLFFLVKFFYLPLMLNFFLGNWGDLQFRLQTLQNNNWDTTYLNQELFPLTMSLLFTIDTIFFVFGYAVESKYLGNKVKSVEPTVFGWVVALICYPPFVDLVSNYAPWYTNFYIVFRTPFWTSVYQALVVVSIGIYVWATVSLGAKCSNLTNRGIVSRGAYRIVRHPAYIAKNFAWWISLLPVLSVGAFLSMAFWSFIYYLRAITEERHLIHDADYQAYCKKVRYRFIPFVW